MPRAGVHGFSATALRRTMNRHGVAPDELAEMVGISRQAVSSWLTSATVPSPTSLARVAEALGVDVSDLAPTLENTPTLVDLRVRAGLTQTAAAGRLNVGRTALGEVERGQRRDMPAGLADAMCGVYGVSRDEIDSAWDVVREERRVVLAARAAARRSRK
ncbi:helix-turn-helix transcriptional regulator [Gordonia tangerina]|nr:helix-turn-helix transcriptional regulator [Gordonia tangerina]